MYRRFLSSNSSKWSILLIAAGINLLSIESAAAVDVFPGTNKIQQGVNDTPAGGTVNLKRGVHKITVTVSINKKLTIVGEGRGNTFIEKHNGSGDVAGLVVNANSCTLRNFTLEGRAQGGPGIMLFSDSNTLSSISSNNCGTSGARRAGVLFDGSNFNSLNNVTANNNSGVGISHWASSGNTLTGCIGDNNGLEGLAIDGRSDNCHVGGGHFNGNRGGVGGIGIDNVNGAWVKNARIDGSAGPGITFQNNDGPSNGCIITGNTITNNGGPGIKRNNCQNALTNRTLVPNTFSNNNGGSYGLCPGEQP